MVPAKAVDTSQKSTMTTIHDVAQVAGVSAATVSRVLSGRSGVNAEMARQVQEAVARLGYRPNGTARNLRRRVAPIWALIISDIENPHFTSLVRGVQDVARNNGRSLVLCNTDEDLERESGYLGVALDERVSGVIVSPASDMQTDVSALLASGIPVVTIDRRLTGSTVPAVVVDNVRGARLGTSHLAENGYRRIACITGPMQTSTARQRLQGFRRALADYGLALDPELVQMADFKEEGGYQSARALLDPAGHVGKQPPDALFVANSLMLRGVLQALRRLSIAVPQELAIVAFDDSPWLELMQPSLSAIRQPTYEIGSHAGRLLLQPQSNAKAITLRTQLIVRDSSQPAARLSDLAMPVSRC